MTPEPNASEQEDMFRENSPGAEERHQRETNEEYLKICFHYALKRQGITDDMMEEKRYKKCSFYPL